jgi:hypothetical protein
MTAAHYIALLLLSTAVEDSREHREIIEQNGPGIWLALSELDLVESPSDELHWRLTERGRVLIDYVIGLPLPEQVSAWRMPGVSISMPLVEAQQRQFWPFAAKPVTVSDADDDGPPPPKPSPPKPIPGITPAADAESKRAQALELINRGFGTSEIADTLEMDQGEVERIFFGA